MKPKKKSHRGRGLGLDSGLDLAISRFMHSLASNASVSLTETLAGFFFGNNGFVTWHSVSSFRALCDHFAMDFSAHPLLSTSGSQLSAPDRRSEPLFCKDKVRI
jgi:hypothetical protein